jgi:chromosome segregation ATPase
MPPQRSNDSNNEDINLEQSLQELEQALQDVKARYAQVQADRERQQDLRQQLSIAERELNRKRSQTLQTEVKQLRQQLDEVELALESQLFSWSGLREAFWQAVRFGGLGVVAGWLLRTWAGGN